MGQSRQSSGVLGTPLRRWGPFSPDIRDPQRPRDPAFHSESRVPDAASAPGPRAGGSPRGAPGIPGRHAAVVERVLTRRLGDGRGRAREGGAAWRYARGRPGCAEPWRPQWPRPPPPAGLYTAAKFRLRPELVPIRDAFPPPPLWPGPRARRAYKAWAGPAAGRRASPPVRAPTSPGPDSRSPVSRTCVGPGSQPWR